jgi:hypothetical protein
VLPDGAVQAIRARVRYRTVQAPCGTSAYDDHDDLVFAVGSSYTPAFTTTTTTTTTLNAHPLSTATAGPSVAGAYLFGSEAGATTSARLLRDHEAPSDATGRRRLDEDAALSNEAALELGARATAASSGPAAAASEPAPKSDVTYGPAQRFELTYATGPATGPAPSLDSAAATAPSPLAQLRVRFDEPPASVAAAASCVMHIDLASTMTFLVGEQAGDTTSGISGSETTLVNTHCAVDLRTVGVAGTATAPQLRLTVRFIDRHAAPIRVHTQTLDADGVTSVWMRQELQESAGR